MAHTQIPQSQLVGTDVQTALTMYRMDFLREYDGIQDPAVVQLGEQVTTTAIENKFPIAVGTPRFKKLIGEEGYRRLSEIFLSVTAGTYQDGVAELADTLMLNTWRGWGDQARLQADAARVQLPEELFATAVMAGKTTAAVDSTSNADPLYFFDTGRPVNPAEPNLGTYDNLFTAKPLTAVNVAAAWKYIRTIKSTNGAAYRNLRWTHVLVGPDLEVQAQQLFEGKFGGSRILVTSGGSTAEVEKNNPVLDYGIKVISSPYLTETGVWYAICAPAPYKAPWLVLRKPRRLAIAGLGARNTPAEGLTEFIVDGLDSEMYKHGNGKLGPGHVAIAAKIDIGAALTVPWRMFRFEPS